MRSSACPRTCSSAPASRRRFWSSTRAARRPTCCSSTPAASSQDDKRQNRLRPEDIEKIVATYQKFKSVPKYAYRAKRKEIEDNEFNLNIPRYVDTSEAEQEIDIASLQSEIERLEAELAKTRKEMKKHLAELGVH